jgi:hypothetical protein
VAVAYLKQLYPHFLRGTEQTHEKLGNSLATSQKNRGRHQYEAQILTLKSVFRFMDLKSILGGIILMSEQIISSLHGRVSAMII